MALQDGGGCVHTHTLSCKVAPQTPVQLQKLLQVTLTPAASLPNVCEALGETQSKKINLSAADNIIRGEGG